VGLFLVACLAPALAQAPGWVLYTHPDKLMSVRFPKEPTVTDQAMPTAVGTLNAKMASVIGKDRAYVAMAVVYPSGYAYDVKKALDASRDRALASVKGKLISEKSVKLDGFEGREIVFESNHTFLGVARNFFSAKPPRGYTVIAGHEIDKPDPDAEKFLDSLHLGKKVETKP